MPRPLRDLDVSATDRRWHCRTCRQRHQPGTPCPPLEVWLVLSMCPHCRYLTGRYCTTHAAGVRR